MKYAIMSDIHGNIDALQSVLDETKARNIDRYIFAGDYSFNLPYSNQTVDIIRTIPNAIVAKGNEEGYLDDYAKQNQSTWTDGQMQAHYWHYRNLTAANHKFLRGLPEIVTFNDNGTDITVTHKSSDLYGTVEYMDFSSRKVSEKYQDNFDGRERILRDMQEFVCTNKDFHTAIKPLTGGIYIFGHSHIQWYARHEDKVFINPGSCGIPLDGAPGTPYSILEIEGGQIRITEHRAQYDTDKLIENMKKSELYKAAPVWSEIMLWQLVTRFELAWPFLEFVKKYADDTNDSVRPYSKTTWTKAFQLWIKQKSDPVAYCNFNSKCKSPKGNDYNSL
ncbi:MAG: metallophosphoesterase family protein [Defluviitaleaceae bacterium]|nr:metallophosphoesterase family protein [Defluviitaleaceae bacterium]